MDPIRPVPNGAGANGSQTRLWIVIGCAGTIAVSCCLCLLLIFSVSGILSETAVEIFDQVLTVEPEFLDDALPGIATMLPELTPTPTKTPLPSPTAQFNCGDVGFTAVPWLQVSAVCEQMPAQTGTGSMDAPAYSRLALVGYPVQPSFHEAQISVFRVEAYREINQEAAARIDQLSDLLQQKPLGSPRPYPLLPVWNAGQTITSKYGYLDFAGGQGIRYLAQYGQAAWPINNEDLFYTFQGLTADGEYYISAVFPITHPELPTNGESYIGEEYEAFINSYSAYLEEVKQLLKDSSSKSFRPRIDELDAVIESITIR